ncbi:hypothetical protein [Capnocytophaga sp.]|uniref:hypothetical protein n=1 Tax=Capnocytophaga sp. TaxID=44737 RepID=UPI0026DD5096|nr:hypothetical protein [Capnocytophaga sp.]MDO5104304.1 hypothetical protein [Capnocytophaga sp.]
MLEIVVGKNLFRWEFIKETPLRFKFIQDRGVLLFRVLLFGLFSINKTITTWKKIFLI